MLHGYTATPQGEEAVTGWTNFFGHTDVLVAYLQGNPTGVGGYGWSTGSIKDTTKGPIDVSDVEAEIRLLISNDCVDPDQIVVAGESNGSGLGLELGCDGSRAIHPSLFALAIPAVDTNVLKLCAGSPPFPLLVMAGEQDQTVTYSGSSTDGLPPFSAPLKWFEQVATSVNGCSGPLSSQVPDATHYYFRSCKSPSNFYAIEDGHHTWPGGPLGAGGLAPGVFPASAVAWCASRITTPIPPVDCSSMDLFYDVTSQPEQPSTP